MHPAFSLAKRKLDEARHEFAQAVQIEAEVTQSLLAQALAKRRPEDAQSEHVEKSQGDAKAPQSSRSETRAERKLDDPEPGHDQTPQGKIIVSHSLSEESPDPTRAAATILRASGIEGVYTGMEGVLKEILTITDGGFCRQANHGIHAC
jgi:hypothetical protein